MTAAHGVPCDGPWADPGRLGLWAHVVNRQAGMVYLRLWYNKEEGAQLSHKNFTS